RRREGPGRLFRVRRGSPGPAWRLTAHRASPERAPRARDGGARCGRASRNGGRASRSRGSLAARPGGRAVRRLNVLTRHARYVRRRVGGCVRSRASDGAARCMTRAWWGRFDPTRPEVWPASHHMDALPFMIRYGVVGFGAPLAVIVALVHLTLAGNWPMFFSS